MSGAPLNRRMLMVVLVLGGLFSLLLVRLFYLQIVQHAYLAGLALKQQERTIVIQPERGCIYDRHGHVLALNRQVSSFYAVPAEIQSSQSVAAQLAQVLKVSATRLERRFHSHKAFVWIKRKVSDAEAQRILALKLTGVHELKEPLRVYPEGKLACHILGFVGLDNQGLAGMELQFDRYIRGQSGWMRISRDARGRNIPTSTRIYKSSQPGQDLYLTIDMVIQHMAERELAAGIQAAKAQGGSIVVMDPMTGEILALANQPDYDPNAFKRASAAQRRNRAVHDVFEPGSTFKLVTAAAALEEAIFAENDIIDCEQGEARFEGCLVRDHEPRGKLSFQDVVVYSSNIGAVKIGLRLGADKLAYYAHALGFGRATGIELPGESQGLLKPLSAWKRWNVISTPFGQGVAVTTMQLAAAYAVIAHSGQWVQPRLLQALKRPDGIITWKGKSFSRGQILSPQTARRLKAILCAVVSRGTGTAAQIATYQVAGKTGTAQKPLSHARGYDPVQHVASFVGFFPQEQPQVLIAVVIDSPYGVQWGGTVAGPIFREVGKQLVAYLGIPPHPQKVFTFAQNHSKASAFILPELVLVPELKGKTLAEAKSILPALGFKMTCWGKGTRIGQQQPAAGSRINPQSQVVLYLTDRLDQASIDLAKPPVVVPQLAGLSIRPALQILQAYHLQAIISGSGVVYQQNPPPNTWAQVGATCHLHCQDPEQTP